MSSSDALQAKSLSWFKDVRSTASNRSRKALILDLQFFATADTLDTRKWLDTFWLPDATVQFSNAPDLSGREVIFSVCTTVHAPRKDANVDTQGDGPDLRSPRIHAPRHPLDRYVVNRE